MSSKTTYDLQYRLQGAIADISSFVSKSDDTQNEQMQSESWDYARYLERVHTYKSTTWFAKPTWMSPIVCSRYGWTNINEDTLQCVGCRSVFVGRLPASYDPVVYDACRKRLENQIHLMAHHPCCVWPGNPTPLSVIEVEGSKDESGDATVLDPYLQRVSGLMKLGPELPVVNPSSMHLNECDLNSLIELTERLDLPNDQSVETLEILTSASVLALCGWEVASDVSWPRLQCKTCNRCSGLWNFDTHSSVSKENAGSRLRSTKQNEDCPSKADEEVFSKNDFRSSVSNLDGNVKSDHSVSSGTVFAPIGGFADGDKDQIIGSCDDSSTLATETKLKLSAEELHRDSVATHSSEDAAESQMLFTCCTSEQTSESDQLNQGEVDNDLSCRLTAGQSIASGCFVMADDELMEAVALEPTGAEFKPEILASMKAVVDRTSENQKTLDDLTNQSTYFVTTDNLHNVASSVEGDTSIVADSVLGGDHLANQLSSSSKSIKLLDENQLAPSCDVPIQQTEADGAKLTIVRADEETVLEDKSLPLQCDLKLKPTVEKLHNNNIVVSDQDNNTPDLVHFGSKTLVPTPSIKEPRESTSDERLDAHDLCFKSTSPPDVELLVCRNYDYETACHENRFDLVSIERREKPLLDDANSLIPLSDNDSQTQTMSSYPCDIVTTRTENDSSARSESDSILHELSSSADEVVNGARLPRTPSDSLELGSISGKRPASPETSDERLFPDEMKRRRVEIPARRRCIFDAVTEHRPWCPWVLSAGAVDEQSYRPWLRLLRNLLSDAARKSSPIDVGSSPKVLESIRYLFRSWAPDVSSQ